ncbi:hypothetical protein V497_06652 [Pseudogymnoascus sp. VKM F-4516 (FW-969)]|nr:hypothetical protein V497_06652 [Pseudogymnoascus sp. VKM F-4516 (FW-969)]
MALTTTTKGFFALNRTKFILFACLVATWTIAGLFPRYQGTLQEQLSRTREKMPSIKVEFHPDTNPLTAYDPTKIALLIEGRARPHLVPQILHMISVVPPEWRFLFIGTNKSVAAVGRSFAIKHQQAAGKLDLMVVPKPWEIKDKEHVWRMLTDKHFYTDLLPGVEWLMKYESDSIMCSNSKDSLNDWLRYDWAAAPRSDTDTFAGNGGLSIRRIAAIKRVLDFQSRDDDSDPEDQWFGKRISAMPDFKVASGLDAKHFSVEEVYREAPMGYHLRDGEGHLPVGVWKNHDQRARILKYCPEVSIILPMKLERERCEGDNREGGIDEAESLAHEKAEAEKSRIKIEEKKKQAQEEAERVLEAERKKKEGGEAGAKEASEAAAKKEKEEEKEAERKKEENRKAQELELTTKINQEQVDKAVADAKKKAEEAKKKPPA